MSQPPRRPDDPRDPYVSAGLFDGMDVTDAVCRWCASGLEELPSGSWVDVFGTQSCTAPGPGMHWPVVLV